MDEHDFQVMDDNPDNNGFEARIDCQEIIHWDYMDESGNRLLQIILEDGIVTMFIGERINTALIELN